MGAICIFRKEKFSVSRKNILSMVVLSVLYAVTALCLVYSYKYIPSGVSTTIHFLYPIFVSFLMVVFFKEKKSFVLLLAAVLSLIGVGLLCWTDNGTLNISGILIVSVTIVTYAVYIVGINKSSVGSMSSEMLTFYILTFGAVLFFGFAVTTSGIEPIPSTSAGLRLFLLAFLPTVISDLTLILAIKYAGSTVTSILGSMEPLVAVCIGILYFSEYFNINSFFGIMLIILSVGIVILSRKKAVKDKIKSH